MVLTVCPSLRPSVCLSVDVTVGIFMCFDKVNGNDVSI